MTSSFVKIGFSSVFLLAAMLASTFLRLTATFLYTSIFALIG